MVVPLLMACRTTSAMTKFRLVARINPEKATKTLFGPETILHISSGCVISTVTTLLSAPSTMSVSVTTAIINVLRDGTAERSRAAVESIPTIAVLVRLNLISSAGWFPGFQHINDVFRFPEQG